MELDDLGVSVALDVVGPGLHQLTPLLQGAAATVCPLDRIADRVCQSLLGDLPRKRVSLPAQSRKAERKPWTVRLPWTFIARDSRSGLPIDSGWPDFLPGNTMPTVASRPTG